MELRFTCLSSTPTENLNNYFGFGLTRKTAIPKLVIETNEKYSQKSVQGNFVEELKFCFNFN